MRIHRIITSVPVTPVHSVGMHRIINNVPVTSEVTKLGCTFVGFLSSLLILTNSAGPVVVE